MKVPRKDFEIFKSECLRLQKLWGLSGWKIQYLFRPLENRFAETLADVDGRVASLTLSSELKSEHWGLRSVKDSARHEMLHMLLRRLGSYGAARYVTEDEMNEAEEELVMQLLKIIP